MKSSTKVIIGVVIVALIGAGVYFGNATLQKGSFRGFPAKPTDAPSPVAASDFLIEYTFPFDPALPCKLETGQSINFVNNSNEPIVVSRLGIYLKGDGFGTFSLGNFSLTSADTGTPKYIYSSSLKNSGIIYFDLSPQALNPQNLPLVVIQPKSKAHYWIKATGQPVGVLASGSTITGKFSFSPVFARYSPQLAKSGTPEKTFAPLPKDYKWKDLEVCFYVTAPTSESATPAPAPAPQPPPQQPIPASAEKSTPPAVACEPGKSLCSATGTKCMTHNECAAAEKEPTPDTSKEPSPDTSKEPSPAPVCPANQNPCPAAGNQCMTQGMCEEITEAE